MINRKDSLFNFLWYFYYSKALFLLKLACGDKEKEASRYI